MKCIFCEQEIKDDAKFCTKCGKQIPRCPTCGRVITKKARFCIKDGTLLPEEVLALVPEAKTEQQEVDDLSSTVRCRPPVPSEAKEKDLDATVKSRPVATNAAPASTPNNNRTSQAAASKPVTTNYQAPKKKNSCLPIVLVLLIVFMLMGAGVIALIVGVAGYFGLNLKNATGIFESVQEYEDESYVEEDDETSESVVAEEEEETVEEDTEEPEQPNPTVDMPTGLAYVIENCDKTYLTASDLQGFDAETCRIARNAIYAKHGRKFADPALQQYFSQFAWYTPIIEPEAFSESMLSAVEIANRDLIVAYETQHGYR